MRVAITGDYRRPGQEGNIAWLWTAIEDLVSSRWSVEPEYVVGTPFRFNDWAQRRFDPTQYPALHGFDIIIGFELSAGIKSLGIPFIDIKRHPIRFQEPLWSIHSTFDLSDCPKANIIPRHIFGARNEDEILFMLQVSSDKALLEGSRLIQLIDVIDDLRTVVGDKKIQIIPHPFELDSPWIDELYGHFPNTKLMINVRTAYEMMGEHAEMVTVSSSTGFEAPYFGCKPHFLRKPEDPSPPYDIANPSFWENI